MSKYQFVLYAGECGNFVERLRDLGMVDITTVGWEPSQSDRDLILDIEAHQKAERQLAEFAESDSFDSGAESYASGDEAYGEYQKLNTKLAEYNSEIEEYHKKRAEAEPWGEFSSELLQKLDADGLKINYFVAFESAYEAITTECGNDLAMSEIANVDGKVYFVVITREGDETQLNIDAQSLRPLTLSVSDIDREITRLTEAKSSLNGEMSKAAASLSLIAAHRGEVMSQLQLSRVSGSAEKAAEGSLLVMEGWAEEAQSAKVDDLLNNQDGLVYFKSNPTPEDNTPVKLKNNWFFGLFEMIGNLYALPKYGTIDLTPFFAPFYMLFFAICLCDAGYGAVILAAGVALLLKGGEKMRQAGWFTVMCGATAVVFGFFANSLFGMQLQSIPIFENFHYFIDFQKDFFNASIAIGVIQILFGMLINIYVTTRAFGFKYALGSVGWFLIIFSSVLAGVSPMMGVGFGFDSVAYYIVAGVGAALLLLFNSPEKNIFANIASGVWETYDRTTGLLGDVLSYIRLFAIGLSGGVLALVFNDLAMGLTGLDEGLAGQGIVSIVVKIIAASLILLAGHGINLFMSTISSLVHPMRLTFVEFYKNAGFEMSVRKFEPLQREEE